MSGQYLEQYRGRARPPVFQSHPASSSNASRNLHGVLATNQTHALHFNPVKTVAEISQYSTVVLTVVRVMIAMYRK